MYFQTVLKPILRKNIMPFTLAHPVAILPLARCRFLHFPALILGSLSPDFVYFLGGQASFSIGHTWLGIWLVNLPLCFVFYAIYHYFWRDALRDYLPNIMNARYPTKTFQQPFMFVVIFTLSAWIGMASHIFLDAFTHETGYFVQILPILSEKVGTLPIFKYLQYGGGVLGLAICAGFMWYSAKKSPYYSPISARLKTKFWLIWLGITFIFFMIWQNIAPISSNQTATAVIRLVDCMVISLTILTIWRKISYYQSVSL